MLYLEAYKSSTEADTFFIYIPVYFPKVCQRDYGKNCTWSTSPLKTETMSVVTAGCV